MREDTPTTYNILFVCTGNTCRSPMAEAIARRALDDRGWTHVSVNSAGTSAYWDSPASEGSLNAAAEIGLDLSGHRSQPLTPELVRGADVILGMTDSHIESARAMGGEGKSHMMSEFLDGTRQGMPIDDPIGGPPEEYAEVRDLLIKSVQALLDRLAAILSP